MVVPVESVLPVVLPFASYVYVAFECRRKLDSKSCSWTLRPRVNSADSHGVVAVALRRVRGLGHLCQLVDRVIACNSTSRPPIDPSSRSGFQQHRRYNWPRQWYLHSWCSTLSRRERVNRRCSWYSLRSAASSACGGSARHS